MRILSFLFIFLSFAFVWQDDSPFGKLNIPAKHQQVVLVTADSWSAATATLQRFYRSDSRWIPYGKSIPVSLGKNGLAWGRGLHVSPASVSEKVEGDGKAPAGIFEFGTAFGYDSIPSFSIKIPYRQATARDYWIDDVTSSDYNKWVRIPAGKENNPKAYWKSYERLKRQDHLYELGLVVKHNMNPPVASKGSAIFFHIWRTTASPTLGCTAMSKADLQSVLSWLDPARQPLLIQIPKGEMGKLGFLK